MKSCLSQSTSARRFAASILSKPVDSQTIKAIYQTWLDHIVIVFRGQNLTQEDHMRATKMFGEVGHIRRPPKYFPAGFDRVLPGIMFISNIRENGEPSARCLTAR